MKSETPIYAQLVIDHALADPEALESMASILRRKQASLQAQTRPPRRTPVQAFTEWLRG